MRRWLGLFILNREQFYKRRSVVAIVLTTPSYVLDLRHRLYAIGSNINITEPYALYSLDIQQLEQLYYPRLGQYIYH